MMDKISEEDFVRSSQTGDILLFTTNRWMSKALRVATHSKYDHVAMIIRNLFPDQPDTIHIFEAVGGEGVRIAAWDDMKTVIGEGKKKHFSKVVYRQVDFDRKEHFTELVLFF